MLVSFYIVNVWVFKLAYLICLFTESCNHDDTHHTRLGGLKQDFQEFDRDFISHWTGLSEEQLMRVLWVSKALSSTP